MANERALSEPITAFGRMLQDWMWSQRPPLSAHKLSGMLAVASGTVWNWLNTERLPQPNILPKIAEVTGISLEELYAVCGIPLRLPESREEANAVWNYIIANLEDNPRVSPNERARIVAHIRQLREQYEAGTGPYQKKP